MRIKDYNSNETIAAIATAPVASALGVIKISGAQALRIVSQVFRPKRAKDIRKAKTYTLHYGWIVKPQRTPRGVGNTQTIIDEVLLALMRKPHSYTGEDVVEISSHGGQVALNAILEVLLAAGCRVALPGEFTYRALRSGRVDLLQAESILDIVNARNQAGLVCAGRQLRGQASTRLAHFKEALRDVFAQTEAALSFPEDHVSIKGAVLEGQVRKLAREARRLLVESDCGRVFQDGIRCVICGKTNAGKSTLFNCLMREERVIVSRIPGTTRDVIEETINIRGVPLRICDTAGILEPRDLLDRKAIEKTSRAFEEADLVIVVLDTTRTLSRDDYIILDKLRLRPQKKAILVANKSDVGRRLSLDRKFKTLGTPVAVSALRNTGIGQLEKAIVRAVYQGIAQHRDSIFLNQFQRKILRGIRDTLDTLRSAGAGNSLDFVNFSLRECLDDIGKICGEVFSEDVLESIFSKFCIGK
ncbi:MAG: tRNA uridine-5-carboxymethylaminomethyl(34) synthesis GTPase MnmE [Candidatus Omnitrophota bacterium]|nr:tRNA uridine-5-carboxymethylaminomethyl(34) synthesis GTPase MnmE [Candidatus Omnitrophota bacterium]